MTTQEEITLVINRFDQAESSDETYDMQFKIHLVDAAGQRIDGSEIHVGIIFDNFLGYRVILDGMDHPYKLVQTICKDKLVLSDFTIVLEPDIPNKFDEALNNMVLTKEECEECRGSLKSLPERHNARLSVIYHPKLSGQSTELRPTSSPTPGRGRDGTTESIFLGRARKRSRVGYSKGSRPRLGVRATRQKPKT